MEIAAVLDPEQEVYPTQDFGLAQFLMATGVELSKGTPYTREMGPDAPRHGKVVFMFDDFKRCKTLEQEFKSGNPTVEVHKFIYAGQRLKSLIYESRRSLN